MATPGPAAESTSSASSPPQFRVRFKKWWAVAVWKWITPNDETECGICRLPFEGCCPDCKFPGDDCALGRRVQMGVGTTTLTTWLPTQCRGSAGTVSTSTAYRSGWRLSRYSNSAQCVVRSGSLANNCLLAGFRHHCIPLADF